MYSRNPLPIGRERVRVELLTGEVGGTCTVYLHVLMRDEKEGRKKQARSNKKQEKATQHTQGGHVYTCRSVDSCYATSQQCC